MPKDCKSVQFYLRLHNGNGCRLYLPTFYTLQHVLTYFAEDKLLLPQTYRLLVNGKYVKNYNHTLEQLSIFDRSILHIEEIAKPQKNVSSIDVTIFHQGEKFILQIKYQDSISTLKSKISQLLGVPVRSQLLVFKGRQLKNDRTVQYYKIESNSLICLQIAQYRGPTSRIEDLLDSVLSLKEKRSTKTCATLFRSDSIGDRLAKTQQPLDVAIKQSEEHIFSHKNVIQHYQLKQSITLEYFRSNDNLWCNQVYSQEEEDVNFSLKIEQTSQQDKFGYI